MTNPGIYASGRPYRLQAAVHADGVLWEARAIELDRTKPEVALLALPDWCRWEKDGSAVVYAVQHTDTEVGMLVYSSRPRSDRELGSMRATSLNIGGAVLWPDVQCYSHELSSGINRVSGIGDFPESDRLKVMANDTGSFAVMTTVLTNIPAQVDLSPQQPITVRQLVGHI